MKIKVIFLAVVLWTTFVNPVSGQQVLNDSASFQKDEAVIKPAIDGIFEAFEKYALVGLGERHNLAQIMVFCEQLIRDPRFAGNVGNVVVEFGCAAHQNVIDRYINGEAVPYTELRQVWTNVAGAIPALMSAHYAHFFFQVRQTNLLLPPEERIRIWLGEPPINWSEIKTRDEFNDSWGSREQHSAGVITKNILARNKKALVIYGGAHFVPLDEEEEAIYARWRKESPETVPPLFQSLQFRLLRIQLETEHPDVFFVAQVYIGFKDEECTNRFEQRFDDWAFPVLATPVLGTSMERDLRECLPKPKPHWLSDPSSTWPNFVQEYFRTHPDDHLLFEGDAILFLGAAAKLTYSPVLDDLFLDEELRQELSRRMEIMTGQPLPPVWLRNIPFVSPYMRDP